VIEWRISKWGFQKIIEVIGSWSYLRFSLLDYFLQDILFIQIVDESARGNLFLALHNSDEFSRYGLESKPFFAVAPDAAHNLPRIASK
jgi:hypothetical protein